MHINSNSEFDLRNMILAAWPDNPVPKTLVSENWGEYAECDRAFLGRFYHSFTYEELMAGRHCLRFFNRISGIYYLPAWLLASIEENSKNILLFDISDYALEYILIFLDDSGNTLGTQKTLFTTRQMLAMSAFLTWLSLRMSQNGLKDDRMDSALAIIQSRTAAQ